MNESTRIPFPAQPAAQHPQAMPGAPAVGPRDDDDEIDLRQYWRVVNRHKVGIIGLAFAVSLLTVLVVFAMTPVFRSSATLLIESSDANVVSIEEVYGLDNRNTEYYQTQFEILKSRELAEDVIRTLGLANHPEFDPLQQSSLVGDLKQAIKDMLPFFEQRPPTEEQLWQGTVEAFRDRVAVAPVPKTQLVKISFESVDADLTAQVANALGEAYIENNLEARLAMTQQAASWLTDRLAVLGENLRESEDRLQAFREAEGLVDVSGVKTLSAQELNELTTQLSVVRKARADAEAQFRQVQGQPVERLETLPFILNSRVVQDARESLSGAELKVADLAERYGPKHPKMISAQAELARATLSFRNQVVKVSQGLREEYERALSNERALERQLEASKGDVQDISRKEYELRELEREVQTNRQLYDMFFTRFKETNETNFEAANARFTDRAVRPFEPVKPRKSLIVGLAFMGSLMLGVLLAFLRESLDNTVKTADDVQEKLHATMLGMLPLMKDVAKADAQASLSYLDGDQKGFSEAVRTIRTGVVLSGLDNPHKVLVVTSSVPNEGKTTLSASLAMALGQMEKVLLIDADMRRPSIAREFGIPMHKPGLSNLVAGTAEAKDCVHRLEQGGIDFIPAGIVPPNPLELLSSDRFKQVLDALAKHYDRIVIDSAPSQAVSDALVLSTRADGLIYVCKADATPYQLAQQGLSRLRHVNAPIIGVVLNQVDVENTSKYYGYGSYYGYYDTYGYSGSSDPAKTGAKPADAA